MQVGARVLGTACSALVVLSLGVAAAVAGVGGTTGAAPAAPATGAPLVTWSTSQTDVEPVLAGPPDFGQAFTDQPLVALSALVPGPVPTLPGLVLGGTVQQVSRQPARTAVVAAATGPVRGATRLVYPGSPQVRGAEALASLPFPWRQLGVTVRFLPYRGQVLGLYEPRLRRVSVYVSPTQTRQGLRITLAHELGHALDLGFNTDATRRQYLVARGLAPLTPWLPCGRCSDYASGAGDFAEVFALAVAGRGDFRSRLAGEPSASQLTALAPFFAPPSNRGGVVDRTAAPAAAPSPAPAPRPAPTPAPTPRSRNLIDGLLGY